MKVTPLLPLSHKPSLPKYAWSVLYPMQAFTEIKNNEKNEKNEKNEVENMEIKEGDQKYKK